MKIQWHTGCYIEGVADVQNTKTNFKKSQTGKLSRRTIMMTIKNLIMNEDGATALEYGLLAALIAAAIVGAVTTLGDVVSTTFSSIASSMTAATTSSGS